MLQCFNVTQVHTGGVASTFRVKERQGDHDSGGCSQGEGCCCCQAQKLKLKPAAKAVQTSAQATPCEEGCPREAEDDAGEEGQEMSRFGIVAASCSLLGLHIQRDSKLHDPYLYNRTITNYLAKVPADAVTLFNDAAVRNRLQLRGGNLLHRASPAQKSAPPSPRASTSAFGLGSSSSLRLGSSRLRPKRKKKIALSQPRP
ncbi:hypothetical protein NL676_019854 [Syzygium grande]|nr:hypothetical protein NL676_019854 [Syzygium grande]